MERSRRAVAVLLLVLGAGACNRQPQEDLLAKGVFLFNESKFEESIPVLKKRLLEDPWDAGAHYYLGRAYLAIGIHDLSKAHLVVAEGELKTALTIFTETGRHSPIERFSDDYFEVTCHLQTSNVYLYQAMLLESIRAPRESIDDCLKKIENENRAVRKITPDSAEVKQYEEEIANTRKRIGIVPAETRSV